MDAGYGSSRLRAYAAVAEDTAEFNVVEAQFRDYAFNHFFDVMCLEILDFHRATVSGCQWIKVLLTRNVQSVFLVFTLCSVSL